jgi:Vitamin K-dependent gamma-carboxylase
MTASLRRTSSAWQRFWFEPQSTSTLALFRIAFGLVVLGWTLSLTPNLFAFLGPDGIEPDSFGRAAGEWGLLTGAGRPTVVAVFLGTLAGAAALTVGWHARIAAVVVFVGIVSIEQRNALISNSGDGLLRNLAFYCMLAPSGAALSLDRLRAGRDASWRFPRRAPWALRLIQIQVSVGYLATVWLKLQGASWRDGTAVSYALRMEDVHRLPTPEFLTRSPVTTEALTFGTLALELALGILVWNRVLRPWVMSLGIVMHVVIEYSIVVGFFGMAVLAAYLAFLSPVTADRLILAARDRFGRRRRSSGLGDGRAPTSPTVRPQADPVGGAAA